MRPYRNIKFPESKVDDVMERIKKEVEKKGYADADEVEKFMKEVTK